uniref:Uncharacterized protein n=1 Tax=Glossina palpalis gambiensis TaxID=67801 RepID=A0A1B0BFT1_9MUSC
MECCLNHDLEKGIDWLSGVHTINKIVSLKFLYIKLMDGIKDSFKIALKLMNGQTMTKLNQNLKLTENMPKETMNSLKNMPANRTTNIINI